jgi:hypothetical protein
MKSDVKIVNETNTHKSICENSNDICLRMCGCAVHNHAEKNEDVPDSHPWQLETGIRDCQNPSIPTLGGALATQLGILCLRKCGGIAGSGK